ERPASSASMQGLLRASARLALMVLVTAAVLVTTIGLGLPAAAVLGLSLTVAGLVGMLGLTRRAAAEAAADGRLPAAVMAPRARPMKLLAPKAPKAPKAAKVSKPPKAAKASRTSSSSGASSAAERSGSAGGPSATDPDLEPDPLVAAMAPGDTFD